MSQVTGDRSTDAIQRAHFRSRRQTTLLLPALLLVVFALLLAGCSGDPGGMQGSGASGAPTLHCATRQTAGQIDVIEVTLTCAVSGAASAETSFTLSYTATNANGQKRSFDATCDGQLHNGEGNCTRTYALVVPFTATSSTVVGKLLPDNRTLGPVTPTKS
ncbi:MAG: hypothetical protein ABI068_01870 [Ktedonobacterales bacterium]